MQAVARQHDSGSPNRHLHPRGAISIEDVVKINDPDGAAVMAVDHCTLSIAAGEICMIVGPSGCGKSTTLRCIAGLEHPDAGRIALGDLVLFDGAANRSVPMNRRNLGMVFQSYAIWPHMTVFENVSYPLRLRRVRRNAVSQPAVTALW